MKGFAQFQDDLNTIRVALYSGQISAAKVDAQRAFERVLAFFHRLEEYDVAAPQPGTAVCPRCGGDGVQLTEVNLSGECRCGSCGGSGRVPTDGSAGAWVNARLAERGSLAPGAPCAACPYPRVHGVHEVDHDYEPRSEGAKEQ